MSVEVAQQIIAEAEDDYKQFNFNSSTDKLKKVIKANPSPVLAKQAVDLSHKCDVFNKLIKNMHRDDMSDLNGLVEIQFNAGQPIIAKLIEERETSITVKQDETEKEIPLKEINRYTRLTQEEYRGKVRAEYQKRLSRLSNPTAKDYYQIALYCYKEQLNEEALSMLELAWGKDEQFLASLSSNLSEQPLVAGNQNAETKKQLAQADEYYKKGKEHMDKVLNKGPDFDKENELANESFNSALEIYQKLQPVVGGLEERIKNIEDYLDLISSNYPEPPAVPERNPATDKQLAQANEYYKKGKEHMEKTLNKGPDFDKKNDLERESFKSALEIYRSVFAAEGSNPDDSFLESRIKDIENCLLYIRKQTPIKHK